MRHKRSAERGVRYAIEHPQATPEEMHAAWVTDRTADGWSYGKSKNAVTKTHPSIRPWDALDEYEQRKDVLFLAVVRALA